MKPVSITRFDQRPIIALLPGGSLMAFFIRTVDVVQQVIARRSMPGRAKLRMENER